jgi:hypothetical protein
MKIITDCLIQSKIKEDNLFKLLHGIMRGNILSQLWAKDLNKAQKYIKEIVLIGKINYQSIIYKAAMLLSIIIQYEWGNLEYPDYEIRSYKRSMQLKGKLLKTERIIFKVVKFQPSGNNLEE